MTAERQLTPSDEIRHFFDRPAEDIASELSSSWLRHENRAELHQGQGKILGLRTTTGTNRFFRIEEVIVYTSDYTYGRWPNTRAPEIDSLQPGDLISYVSRAATLTFIKTRRAENIQFSHLQEVDRFGDPIRNQESTLKASGVAKVAGLKHKEKAHLLPFNFRGEKGLMLASGSRMLTEDELRRIEEEILGDLAVSDEDLEKIEKEILDDTGK